MLPKEGFLARKERNGLPRADASYSTSNPEPAGEYLTSPAATGHLLIRRFDSMAHIVLGTFEVTAQKVRGEGPETVQITNGRFAVQYLQ